MGTADGRQQKHAGDVYDDGAAGDMIATCQFDHHPADFAIWINAEIAFADEYDILF